MDPKQFYDKQPHPLLWAGWQAARDKIKISAIFLEYTRSQCGLGSWVEDPRSNSKFVNLIFVCPYIVSMIY